MLPPQISAHQSQIYSLPTLLKHKHVAFHFLPQTAYEKATPLEIQPVTDIVGVKWI